MALGSLYCKMGVQSAAKTTLKAVLIAEPLAIEAVRLLIQLGEDMVRIPLCLDVDWLAFECCCCGLCASV